MNKFGLIVDLLICSVWAIFVWHFSAFSFLETWSIALFALYPVFLRLNISFMLFRNDRRSVWSVLTFIILSLPGIVSGASFKAIDRMIFYSLYVTGIIDYPTHLFNNQWLLSDGATSGLHSLFYFIILISLAVWIWLIPIFILISKAVRKKLMDSLFSWYTVWVGYFQDPLVVQYFSLFALTWVSFMVGAAMPYHLSLVATWAMPCIAYYLISKYTGRHVDVWVYLIVVLSSILFWYSQYTMNVWRIGLLALSGALIAFVSFRMWRRSGFFIVSVFTLVLCGFVLPLFSVGYNVYSVTDAKRISVFSHHYSKTGVLRIVSEKGIGLRDRYGVIVEPDCDHLSLICTQSQKPYISVTKDGVSKVYNLLQRSYVPSNSDIDDELQMKTDTLLNKYVKGVDDVFTPDCGM